MKFKSFFKYSILGLRSDFRNVLRYGFDAPRYVETINISIPSTLYCIPTHPNDLGRVATSWPNKFFLKQCEDIEPIKSCLSHWIDGIPWAQTYVFERMQILLDRDGYVDGCRSMSDVFARYERLDRIFDQIRSDGRIRPMNELNGLNYREWDGIYFHIGPNGEPFFGMIGQHRMAIILALGIKNVPAALASTHISSIGLLSQMRVK